MFQGLQFLNGNQVEDSVFVIAVIFKIYLSAYIPAWVWIWTVVIALIKIPFPLLLVSRIKDEEKILEEGLPGYKEYKQKVKYRLIPFVW